MPAKQPLFLANLPAPIEINEDNCVVFHLPLRVAII